MSIENFRKTSDISTIGKFTGETYMGQFTFKVSLSPMDLINADRTYRELLGGNHLLASPEAQQMAFAIAQLKYRVVKFPAWWEETTKMDSNFFDYSVLTFVLNKALEAEDEYRAGVDERLKEMSERIGTVIRKKAQEPEEEEFDEDEE